MSWLDGALAVLDKVKFWDRAADVAADVVTDMLMKEQLEDMEPQEAFELGHEFALFQRDIVALALTQSGVMQGYYKVHNWDRMRLLCDSLKLDYSVKFHDKEIGDKDDPTRFTLTVAASTKDED
jgi:hypothetical protein